MRKIALLSFLLCGLGFLHEASAASYYWTEASGVKATYTYRWGVTLSPSTSYTFSTNNLSTGADTVMHLLCNAPIDLGGTVEVAYNDDCPGSGSFRSCITYVTPGSSSCTSYTVVVRAYANSSGGDGGKTFEYFFGATSYGVHKLGGYIASTVPAEPTANETMETVLLSPTFTINRAAATLLYRLEYDGTHWKWMAWNQTSGVGLASKLAGSASTAQRWVIATPTETTNEGGTNLVRNDHGILDTDQDGLGDGLEAEACLCSTLTAVVCGYSCSNTWTPDDTDGDGLRDDWELVGWDDPTFPQLFPLWSANPRHKDIFVEIDRKGWWPPPTPPTNPITETAAVAAANYYKNLPLISNPDGVVGINLHLDTGYWCGGWDPDGITDVCGNMGGSNVITTAPADGWCYHAPTMSPVREDMFHLMINDGGGHVSSGYLSSVSCVQENGSVIAHELGHQLDLRHWGQDSAGIVNAKPQYKSIMNYAYSYVGGITFSDGTRSSLDPSNLSETTNFSGTTPDISFMTALPYAYHTNPLATRQFDWNRDGDYDSSVMAHAIGVSPAGADGPGSPFYVSTENVVTVPTNVGMGTTAWNYTGTDAVWIAANAAADNHLRLSHSTSFSGGWATFADLGGTLRTDSEPSLVSFTTLVSGDLLFVFGSLTTGNVSYQTVTSSGVASGVWASLGQPTGAVLQDVSAAVAQNRLYVVGRNRQGAAIDQVWYGYFTNAMTWSGWIQALDGGASPILSDTYSPAIASGPDGKIFMVVKAAAGARAGDLDMYVLDPATGSFTLEPTGFWQGSNSTDCPPSGRPGIVFAPHKKSAPAGYGPLSSGNGALWLYFAVFGNNCYSDKNKSNVNYRVSEGKYNATTQTETMGRLQRATWGGACYSGPTPSSGVAVANGKRAVTTFTTQRGSDNWETPTTSCLEAQHQFHVPYADGTGSVTASDFNDQVVIKNNLCLSINDQACICQSSAGWQASCSSTPFVEDPILDCPAPPP